MNTTNVHGVNLITDDDMVVLAHNRENGFEKETVEKFCEFSSKFLHRGHFVDVGAYTGFYSILAAHIGLMVTAFEPNPFVYARLLENIAIDVPDPSYIQTHNVGLSDDAGYVELFIKNHMPLTSASSIHHNNDKRFTSVRALVDVFDGNHPAPNIVKIDVEGHELNVLNGMKESIRLSKPYMIVEANNEWYVQKIKEFFDQFDFYEFTGVYDGRNLIFEPTS